MQCRSIKRAFEVMLFSAMLFAFHQSAHATDVWDASGLDDNNMTDNELTPGADQKHDLQQHGVADQDWFLFSQAPYSSYEFIVDGLTEEIAGVPVVSEAAQALRFDYVNGSGGIITGSLAISGIKAARSLRIRNETGAEINSNFIRVMSAESGCDTACTADSEYRIRVRETTLMIPRFNNSGSQQTILIMQNGSRSTVHGTARFWSVAGALVASAPFTMPARGAFVVNTSTVAGAGGVAGVITVDHDGRYGEVTGKSVALEPSTGFSFDSPAVPRLY